MYNFIRNHIAVNRGRSAWSKGVAEYALEIVESLEQRTNVEKKYPANVKELQRWALFGAMDWTQYSEGGCALIYNVDIAERLCTQSELKKTRNGQRNPNPRESWIDVQTRALYQAWSLVRCGFEAAQQIVNKPIEYAYPDTEEIPGF